MKKSLLITTSLLTLGVVTGIYAQSVGATGTIVDKMKAVAHSFTLAATLNPSDTGLTSDPVKGKKTGDILTAGEWNRVLELVNEGGGGSGGAGWVNVPLTDTTPFDQACEYRFQLNLNGVADTSYTGQNPLLYAGGVDPFSITYVSHVSQVSHINSATKSILRVNGVATYTVTKIEKLCGGGGVSGGTGSPVSGRAVAVRASGHTLAIPSGITDWPDAIVCDGYGGWAGGTEVLSLDLTGNNVVGYTQSEGIGVFFDPSTGVLARADRVGACGASGNIAAICAAGRCVYGGSASVGSSWIDVPLTDTADFDSSCDYKLTINYLSGPNSVWMGASNGSHLASGVSTKYLSFVHGGTDVFGVRSTNKNQYGYRNVSGVYTQSTEVQITKLQKRCN